MAVEARSGRVPLALAAGERRGARWVAVTLGLTLLAIVALWALWDITIDDAYITFRYSEHLALGHGPTWNVGANPVEGYTDFLWMVMLALPARIDPGIVADTAKAVSVVALVLTAVQLLAAVARKTGDRVAGLFAVLALLLYAPTYVQTVAGLETVPFALLVLRIVVVGLDSESGRLRPAWELPLLTLLAGLMRPEGVAFGVVTIAYVLLRQPAAQRRRLLAWTALVLVVPGTAYFAWRLSYYGWPLPNTLYVKLGGLSAGRHWLVGVLPLLLGALALWLARWRVLRSPDTWLVVALLVVSVVPYSLSQPLMDYAHRFQFHFYPVLCLMLGLSAGALRRRWPSRASLVAAGAVAGAAVFGLFAMSADLLLYGRDLDRAHVRIGQSLAAAQVPSRDRTLALWDAGAIPFYSQWDSLDFVGLSNEEVAHGADPASVVTRSRPTALILYSTDGRRPARYQWTMRVGAWLGAYRPVTAVPFRGGYWELVYLRRDLPAAVTAELARRLERIPRDPRAGVEKDSVGAWLRHLKARL
jgi:hypothetical protein